MEPGIRVRRVYDRPTPEDGKRVLVDRIWPRGLRKDAAQLDEWAKDVAPSSELRTWYGHDPAKFGEFCRRYTAELAHGAPQKALDHVAALAAAGPVTLLTATRDVDHSQAAVLAQLLQHQASAEPHMPGEPHKNAESRAPAKPREPAAPSVATEGGEAACYAHLVCPDCGAVTTEGHRPGCSSA